KLNRLLGILRQYSLIKISGDDISIHRLVSNWLKDKLDQEHKLRYIKKMQTAIEKIYPRKIAGDATSGREQHLINQIIPQLEKFLQEVSSFSSDEGQVSLYAITYRVLNEPHKAEHILEEALKINESFYGEHHITNLQILNLLSSVYHHLGKSSKNLEILKKIVSISEKSYGKEHQKTACALFQYNIAYLMLGDFRKVKKLLPRALALYQKNYGDDHVETTQVLETQGWVDYVLGERVKGKKILEHTLKIHSQSPISVANLAYSKILLGFVHYDIGHFEESKKYFRSALKIRKKLYGFDRIWTALSAVNLALVCATMHETLECQSLLDEAARFIERDEKITNVWTSVLISRMGIVYSILGDNLQSKKMLTKSIDNLKKKYGNNHLFTAIVSANLGNVYRLLGDVKKAKDLLRQSLAIIQNSYGDNNPTTAMVMSNLALTMGSKEKKKLLEKALGVFTDFYPLTHPNIRKIASELEEGKVSTPNVNGLKKSPNPGYYILLPF
ncbi:MAG: tetratricopeptide repeat protein, partial [Pseudomonadota bacterium]